MLPRHAALLFFTRFNHFGMRMLLYLYAVNPTIVMKQVKLLLALLCLSFLATATFANPDPSADNVILSVEPVKAKTIEVHMANLQKTPTRLILKELNGDAIFFRETIRNHNGYGKKLSLEKLPKGRYLLTVSQKDAEWTSVVYVDSEKVQVSGINN